MKKVLNLSNHVLTGAQVSELTEKGYEIVELSDSDKKVWGQLDPYNYKEVIDEILSTYSADLFHVAGFPPAVVYAVEHIKDLGKEAIYAYSVRESIEEHLPDGSVIKKNIFKHIKFFEY